MSGKKLYLMVDIDIMNVSFPYLQNLNPEQRLAVEHRDGPILVLAGAGSGKTRILTHRVAHLVLAHGISPGRILAVTFTNKATDEMRERLQTLLGQRSTELWVATFHSSCLRILRRNASALGYNNDFVVYDDNDSKQLIKQLMKSMSIDPKEFTPQYFSAVIDQAKNSFISPEELLTQARGYKNQICAELYDRYQKDLRLANAMDFGDLLVNTLRLFLDYPGILRGYQEQLDYILVDEFQDTNQIQYRLVKLLSERHHNLLVVGDDDQSIYAFRGATVENILAFEKDFPGTKTIKLEQNYRSSGIILDVAHAVISKNTARKDKKLWTNAAAGDLVQTHVAFDEDAEAAFIAREIKQLQKSGTQFKDVAVFYRTNAQSRALEEAFISHEIPYRIFGGLKFFDRKEVKDVLAYLRIIVSDRDNQAFIRIINTPARGIGAKTLQSIADYSFSKSVSLWEAALELSAANSNLRSFMKLINEFRQASLAISISELIKEILEKTDYTKKLEEDDSRESQSRLENLRELVAVARGYDHSSSNTREAIQQFLDRVSLTSSADIPGESAPNSQSGYVSFMTLHLAKGLEFPVVFFTGLEEGLLPHSRSLASLSEIEEERRLCYVGITRAMRRLYFSRSERRSMFSAGSAFGAGQSGFREVSRFIKDVPTELLNHLSRDFLENRLEDESSIEYFSDTDLTSQASISPSKSLASLQKKLRIAQGFLKPAADLEPESYDQDPINPAPLESITPGSRILHPSFGRGVVLDLENLTGTDLRFSKVSIQFDSEKHTRKLVLGKARLALVD